MESILEAINEWIKEILIGAINGNLSTMFGDVNEKVGTIAAEVGKTPQGWNANIFSMIQNLSENVIVPIAGLVITYVLCYELISMVTEKNNMHDVDTFLFFKWFFKAFVAVFLVTHTFDITMAVFDMAQHIVSGAAGVIGGDTNIDVTEALAAMQEGLKDMEIPELQICGMALFTFIGEMPLIAHCGKKQNSFKGGAVAAFLLGYISIYFKNPIIRNLYPLSAGLSIVGFNGEGFVTDTTGAYSSSQSILLGVLTMLAMLILSLIIISIPQKETLATPLSQKRRKTERKIAK